VFPAYPRAASAFVFSAILNGSSLLGTEESMAQAFSGGRPNPWRLGVAALSLRLVLVALVALVATAGIATAASSAGTPKVPQLKPVFTQPAAFDVSLPLRVLAAAPRPGLPVPSEEEEREIRPEPMSPVKDTGYSGDGALQSGRRLGAGAPIAAPLVTFEGLSNEDNFNFFGGRVNPPDPVGAVGPNNYVEMINLMFAVYDKAGNRLAGPTDTGSLWAGFAVPDCTDPSGDPIVIYDKMEDRWILSQFTTRGLDDPTLPFYNCVAVSVSGDPTGAYYRYAFATTFNGVFYFPDYPKYGNWKKSYVLTSRDFGPTTEYGISVYALEKNKMIAGNPNARMVHFFIDSAVVPLELIGDGLLPADFDGTKQPKEDAAIPVVGTQDDDSNYGATFDALNVWELRIQWNANPSASLILAAQLPVAEFDSIFPCGGVAATRATVSRSRRSRTRRDAWTSCPTGSARRGGWRIATSIRTRPSSRTSRSRRSPAWPASAGTRSGETAAAPIRCISREPTPRATACTAGWAASPRTRTATWRSATASPTRPTSSPESATRVGSSATRWGK